MIVSGGTKLYGRVKQIGNVSIVTKFVMFQELPVFPLESFYLFGDQQTKTQGIPILAMTSQTRMDGFRLAKVDTLSAVYAYIRAICLSIFLAGFLLGFLGGILYFQATIGAISPPAPLEGGWLLLQVAVAVFVVACIIGPLTYVVPRISQREQQIREYCGELLGYCIDPARIIPESARSLEDYIQQLHGHESNDCAAADEWREVRHLAIVRCQISQAHDVEKWKMEADTDRVLQVLAQSSHRESAHRRASQAEAKRWFWQSPL